MRIWGLIGLAACGNVVPEGFPELSDRPGAAFTWVEDGEVRSATSEVGCAPETETEGGELLVRVGSVLSGDGERMAVYVESVDDSQHRDVELPTDADAVAGYLDRSRGEIGGDDFERWAFATDGQVTIEDRRSAQAPFVPGVNRLGTFWGTFEGTVCNEAFECLTLTEGRYSATWDGTCNRFASP
ncbi:MAG: hypothetical protein AAGA48_02635 [Myxococcota bacterium]